MNAWTHMVPPGLKIGMKGSRKGDIRGDNMSTL